MRLHITDQVTNHTALSHPIKNLNSLTRSQEQGKSRDQNIHNNTHYDFRITFEIFRKKLILDNNLYSSIESIRQQTLEDNSSISTSYLILSPIDHWGPK